MTIQKMKTIFQGAALGAGVLLAGGCAGLQHYTLPATHEKSYEFSGYTVYPPQAEHWRLRYENQELNMVSFINSEDYSILTVWVVPYFKNQSPENTSKGTVEYFQNKILKEYRLSPDVRLSDQDIKHSEETIADKAYQVLTLTYDIEKEPYELVIYYQVALDNQLMLNASYLINKKKINKDKQPQFLAEVKDSIARIEARKADPQKVIFLRVYYSYFDFIDSAKDKYLKEKQEEIRGKFETARQEIEEWARLKTPNDRALNLLGLLATYNEKFEEYGEGFDAGKAESDFKQAIAASSYNMDAAVNLAKLYKQTGRIDEAVKEYQAALIISPMSDEVYHELGKIEEARGDKVKAKEYYKKAVRYWQSGGQTLDELKKKIEKL